MFCGEAINISLKVERQHYGQNAWAIPLRSRVGSTDGDVDEEVRTRVTPRVTSKLLNTA